MTESNNYCKKNQPNKQTSNWRSFVFELEHSKASRKLNLEHWENESRARVGALGNKSRARVGARAGSNYTKSLQLQLQLL